MLKRITGLLFIAVLAVTIVVPAGFAAAVEETDPEVVSIDEQIKALTQQIEELRKKRQELLGQRREEIRNAINTCRELNSQLRQGMRGEEVTELQELLAEDPDVYPEALITGFFGPLTREAVIKFQRKHGIDAVGEVGPITRIKIKAVLAGKRCNVNIKTMPPNVPSSPPIPDDARSDKEHKVILCHKGETIDISIRALFAHIGHGDKVGPCSGGDDGDEDNDDGDDGDNDDDNDNSTTTPDTTAPVISGVASADTTDSSTKVQWTTDEPATSKVDFGTTTAYGMVADSADLVTSHSLMLSSLSASTTYHMMVTSVDEAGNTTTTPDMTFSTL